MKFGKTNLKKVHYSILINLTGIELDLPIKSQKEVIKFIIITRELFLRAIRGILQL